MGARNEFCYWLVMTFLGGVCLYFSCLIVNAFLGNGIEMHRVFLGYTIKAHAGPYYFSSEPVKFCGLLFVYAFMIGGVVAYMRNLATERKFQIEMMRLRGE